MDLRSEVAECLHCISLHWQDHPSGISDQETKVKDCWKEDFPLLKQDWVREHLGKLDIHKSLDSDGMHPWVLRNLVDTIVRPFTIISERLWQSRVGESKYHPGLQKGQEWVPRGLQSSHPHLNPWKRDGEYHSGSHLYLYRWHEGDQELSALVH